MALTYGTAVTVDQGGSGTSPIVITKPSSTAAGSLLLAAIQHTAAGVTITTPAGWTLIQRTVSATGCGLTTFYRSCDGSEGATFSFTAGSNDIWEGCIVRYEGASATPYDVNSTNFNSSGTTMTASAVTTTAADETVTCVYVTWNSATITNGASQTERLNFGSNGNIVLVSDFTVASAGTSGAKTATQGTSDHWCAQQIAWKNTAGSGPAVPTLVAAGTAAFTATTSASITPGLPTGWAQDDIGILLYAKGNNDDLATPSGWTEILTANQNNTTFIRVEVFVRRLQSGDSAPVIPGSASTVVRGARILAIRGVPTTGTAESWITASRSNNAASATVTFATITPPDANSLLLALEAYEDDPTARTTPSGWGAPVIATSSLGNDLALTYATRSWVTAATATGAITWTVSGGTFTNSNNTGILLGISPGTGAITLLTVDAVTYGVALVSRALALNRTTPAVGWGVATLTKAGVLSRGLTALAYAISTTSKAIVASRALTSVAWGVTSTTAGRIYVRAVSAVAWGVASVARGASIPRTLNAVAHGTATLSRSLTLNRSLTSLSWGVGVVSKAANRVRTLTSVAWGVATVTRLKAMARTLNATAWGIAAVSKRLTAIRSLSATAWAVPTVTKAVALTRQLTAVAWGIPTASSLIALVQTLTAVAYGSATIVKNTIKPRTLTAIAWGVTSSTRSRRYARSLIATAVGVAATSTTIVRAALVYKRISGVAFLVEQITGIIRKKRT